MIQFLSTDLEDYDHNVLYDTSRVKLSNFAVSTPMAMPLKRMSHGHNKPIRRTEEIDEHEKDTKISKIFQLTVTALSFLAFGGYLMTLIITVLRRNQSNGTTTPGVIVLSVCILIRFFNETYFD